MKHLLPYLTLLAMFTPPVLGEVPQQPHARGIESKGYIWNKPDVEKNKALKHKGDITRGKEAYRICQGCHKEDASGRSDAIYPQLAGQHTTVLIKQMVDIRAGRRDNPKMHPFIAEWVITAEDVADIAAYLHSLPVPTTNGKGEGKNLERGKDIYETDCASCHGDAGEGKAKKFYPMVAAQHYDYLFNEAVEIRDGGRRNANPKMVKIIKKYPNEDLQAVSDYMSRLPPPSVRVDK